MQQTIVFPYEISSRISQRDRDRLLRGTDGVVLDDFAHTMIIRLRPGQDLRTVLAEN